MMSNGLAGTTIWDNYGRPYHLTEILGKGGQGTIWGEETGKFAIKIIEVKEDSKRLELQRRYNWLLQKNENKILNLVFPEAILAPPLTGYVMLRVKGHKSISSLIKPLPEDYSNIGEWFNVKTGGLWRRLRLGAMLCKDFKTLQDNNLAYCDISDTNILIPKDSNKVSIAIIDPDNISTSGAASSLVMGTPKYMAPEILRGSHQPDALTDNYSLAVILFHILKLGHPFWGDKVLDGPPSMEEFALMGNLPYIEHPKDDSNRCSMVLPSSAVFSKEIEELFLLTFTEGVERRNKRPEPDRWIKSLLIASDNLTDCNRCKATFYHRALSNNKFNCQCPWCDNIQKIPPVFSFYEYTNKLDNKPVKKRQKTTSIVVREQTTYIKGIHFGYSEDKANEKFGAIKWNRDKNEVLLKNKTRTKFIVVDTCNMQTTIFPEKFEKIPHNSRIYFNSDINNNIGTIDYVGYLNIGSDNV